MIPAEEEEVGPRTGGGSSMSWKEAMSFTASDDSRSSRCAAFATSSGSGSGYGGS